MQNQGDSVKEKIAKILKDKKASKVILILGIVGIALIFISDISGDKTESVAKDEFSSQEYSQLLEQSIRQTVQSICGDSSPVVMVTLDSGMVYEYAKEIKEKGAEDSEKTSEESEKTFITVRDKNGAEIPLVITAYMPKIRGVSIICSAGDEDTEKIKNAVCAALDIPSRKIYIGRKTVQ